MANPIPCPNPACTNVFAAADIQSASAIKCPRCGYVFQLRAHATAAPVQPANPLPRPRPVAATPPPATRPSASKSTPLPPTAPGVGTFRTATPPMAAPVGQPFVLPVQAEDAIAAGAPSPEFGQASSARVAAGEPPAADARLEFGGDGPLVRRRTVRRSSPLIKVIVAGALLLLVTSAIIGSYLLFKRVKETVDGADPAMGPVQEFTGNVRTIKNNDEKAFKLVLPKGQWIKDADLRSKLGVIAAWKNDKEDFWFAVYAKDYGQARPRDAELLEKGIEKLEQYFGESLELAAKAEPTKLADQPGLRLTFRGTLGTITWSGEMIMAAHHGFGYWLFIAGQTSELARTQWEELQTEHTGLKIVTERKGWSEQPAKMVTYRGESGLTLTATHGIWDKVDVKDIDERGELCLFGRYKRDKDKDDISRNRKNAMVLITTMEEKKGDLKETMKAARELFETKMKEQNKSYNFTKAEEGQSELGVDERFGNIPGRVLELKQSIGDEPMRYVILAVAAGQNFLVQCDCTWESRQIWRQDFLELLRTMKTKAVEQGD